MTAAPESKRLKAAGLVLLVLSVCLFAWLSGRVTQAMVREKDALVLAGGTLVAINLCVAGLLMLAAGCGARTSWRNQRQRRALILKVLLANVLVPAVIYGVLTSDESINAQFEASNWFVLFSLAGLALMVIAWRMWRRSQRYEAPDAAEAMANDPRRPVLYLRSFKDDGDAVLGDGASLMMRRIIAALAPRTPEQELADILDHLGPVVAIGKPSEPLPELGAARLYVTHDQWQQRVTELMESAALVVIRVGASAGVLWEIEQALARIPRSRIVLAVLGSGSRAPALATSLAPIMGAEWSAALPQPAPRGLAALFWHNPRRRIGSVVCFPGNGAPSTVPVTRWPPWGRDMATMLAFRPSAMPLRRTWRQTFALLGLEAGTMHHRRSRAVAVCLALAFGYFGAHWFYLGNRKRGWKYLAFVPLAFASVFMAYYDALRFLWVDRATFDTRFVATPRA